MKVLGIIAEYNPFHNGHLYQINAAKKLTNADFTIAVMSGNFTQQGNVAIYDKFTRAKIAVENGIDMVIELPTIYSTASAQYFALGAVNLLNNLNIVDYLCFGSEEGNINTLKYISNIITKNEENIWKATKLALKTGVALPVAKQIALQEYLSLDYLNIMSKSNNILGIEYLNALTKLKSNIQPLTIKRMYSDHLDINISNSNEMFSSATSIRDEILNNNWDNIYNFIPKNILNDLSSLTPISNNNLLDLLKYEVITMDKPNIQKINGVTEGLENKIIKEIISSQTFEELVNNIKSKRYTTSRINRLLINTLLAISKDFFIKCTDSLNTYAHILAISNNGKILLSELSKNSNIEIFTKLSDKVINNIEDNLTKEMLNLDILTTNIYRILNSNFTTDDFTNKL